MRQAPHEKVIRDFRQRMVVKGTIGYGSHKTSALRNAVQCPFGGCPGRRRGRSQQLFKMREMESVHTSVLPAGILDWDEYRKKEKGQGAGFCDREMTGSVYGICFKEYGTQAVFRMPPQRPGG